MYPNRFGILQCNAIVWQGLFNYNIQFVHLSVNESENLLGHYNKNGIKVSKWAPIALSQPVSLL